MTMTKKSDDLSHFSTMSGTPSDICTRMLGMKSQRVIAFAFEHGSERDIKALADTMSNMAPLIGSLIARRQQKVFDSIIEALVPEVPIPQHMIIEARMTVEARKAVLNGGSWLTAAQVAEIAGFSATNPSAQPNKWKRDGAIFAVKHKGIDYFPGYALDPGTQYRPFKALERIIKIFDTMKDAWGLAYWFASANSFLGGQRPQDLLGQQPEQVMAAANDEVSELGGVAYG